MPIHRHISEQMIIRKYYHEENLEGNGMAKSFFHLQYMYQNKIRKRQLLKSQQKSYETCDPTHPAHTLRSFQVSQSGTLG